MFCPRCHAQTRPDAVFCVDCGTPLPATRVLSSDTDTNAQRRRRRTAEAAGRPPGNAGRAVLLGGAAVLLTATTIATTLLILGLTTPTTTPGPAAKTTAAGNTSTDTTTTAPTAAASSPDGSDPPTGQARSTSAEDQLNATVDEDRADVDAVADSWVPQLSSKQPGTVADGFTYTNADIVADYQRNRANYSEARLLRSSDWPVFAAPDYYVTIAAISFATADQANAWCDTHYLAANDCYAKKLSRAGGLGVTTKHRG